MSIRDEIERGPQPCDYQGMTPRTDDVACSGEDIAKRFAAGSNRDYVIADFARTLERELRSLEGPSETAWLIEMPSARWGTGFYWCSRRPIVGNHWGTIDEAIRFARKVDAERVIESLIADDRKHRREIVYEACEHEWSKPSETPKRRYSDIDPHVAIGYVAPPGIERRKG